MRFLVWTVVVVVVVLVLVLSLSPDGIHGHHVMSAPRKAFADISHIVQAVDDFHEQNRRYPATLTELCTLDEHGRAYLNTAKIPLDPWKREYVYAPPDPEHHRVGILLSWGRDGEPGGEGDDSDIVEWVQFFQAGAPK